MPVALQVRQVRDELFRAAGGLSALHGHGANDSADDEPAGAKSNRLLGRLFHELFQELVQEDSPLYWGRLLADAEPSDVAWRSRLAEEAWRRSIGPKLGRHRAALQDASGETLCLWQAVGELCKWLADILWVARAKGAVTTARNGTLSAPGLVAAEQPLLWIIKDPAWNDSVRLSGICDALWRTPLGDWCVVELKLGRNLPEADLGQAALYHQMLTIGLGNSREPICRALALVRFAPRKTETLLQGPALAGAIGKLKELIGRMTGVDRRRAPAPRDPLDESVLASDSGINKAGSGINLASGSGINLGDSGINLDVTGSGINLIGVGSGIGVANGRTNGRRKASPAELELGKRLVQVCKEYQAPVELAGEPVVGAAFVRFAITPGKRVRRAALERLAPELQMRLGLTAAPFVGQQGAQMVVDVQRPTRDTVQFADIRKQLPEVNAIFGSARLPLGVDLHGKLHSVDLAEPSSAHVLAAGTSGSGKSEWLRTALAGLMLANTPETLRLVLIDPKRAAFTELRDSPFLRNRQALVYPDERPATEVLEQLVEEMEDRYRVFAREGVDSLAELARKLGQPQQRIVCLCDEYYDLLMRDRAERKEFEELVCRLGAKARAAGIHLVLATQQPSRETIKGALDANMSARIGFLMKSKIESRMLLGQGGCENLLGRGDMLYRDTGEPLRLQAALLSKEDRAAIFAGGQGAPPRPAAAVT